MDDVNLTPEPIRFYGTTTTDVSYGTELWFEINKFDLELLAPVRIKDGSVTPEKDTSTISMAFFDAV